MYEFLKDCRRVEQLAEMIYMRLALNPSYAEKIRKTLYKLGTDEGSHARLIDLLLQAAEGELEAFPRMTGTKVAEALALAERILAELDSRALSEEDALRRALLMEQEFVKVHVHNVLHFNSQRLAELFEKLGHEDQVHIDTLRECLSWWQANRRAAGTTS
jgi:rubrerythrin